MILIPLLEIESADLSIAAEPLVANATLDKPPIDKADT